MSATRKRLFPILFIFVTLIGIYYLFDSRATKIAEYNEKLAQARNAADKKIIVDAVAFYEEAIELIPNVDLYAEVADMYLDNGMNYEASKWYENEMLSIYPKEPVTYLEGIKANIADHDYEEAFEIYDSYTNRKLYDERVESLIRTVWYSYELGDTYDAVGAFSNISQLAPVCSEDKCGYQGVSGSMYLNVIYKSAGVCDEIAPVVDESGNAFFIDDEGNVKLTAELFEKEDPSFGKIREFRGNEDGLVLATNGETWNYYYLDTYQKAFGGYADAKVILNGIGAVADETGAWALINNEGTLTTDFRYRDVLSDRKGYICKNSTIIVKEVDKFYLVDSTGNRVSSQGYDDAHAFYDYDSLAAVKKGTEWLFVDETGKEYNLGKYDEADSFSNGLAAVAIDGKWGYIDMDGNFALDCQFEGAEPVSKFGVCFVSKNPGTYTFLKFYKDNH